MAINNQNLPDFKELDHLKQQTTKPHCTYNKQSNDHIHDHKTQEHSEDLVVEIPNQEHLPPFLQEQEQKQQNNFTHTLIDSKQTFKYPQPGVSNHKRRSTNDEQEKNKIKNTARQKAIQLLHICSDETLFSCVKYLQNPEQEEN